MRRAQLILVINDVLARSLKFSADGGRKTVMDVLLHAYYGHKACHECAAGHIPIGGIVRVWGILYHSASWAVSFVTSDAILV